jgi:hypothetical protein
MLQRILEGEVVVARRLGEIDPSDLEVPLLELADQLLRVDPGEPRRLAPVLVENFQA